jgi:predicted transcriptional regulator
MSEDVLTLTAQIVSAHVKNNATATSDVPGLIREVFRALSGLGDAPAQVAESAAKPAVPATKSVFPSYIVCMECGKKMTMLKRHLMTEHSLTTDQYRTKYNLPGTYPMVAPEYAQTRSSLAKEMGLGKSRSIAPKKAGRRK